MKNTRNKTITDYARRMFISYGDYAYFLTANIFLWSHGLLVETIEKSYLDSRDKIHPMENVLKFGVQFVSLFNKIFLCLYLQYIFPMINPTMTNGPRWRSTVVQRHLVARKGMIILVKMSITIFIKGHVMHL